ncbi:MAG: hypothetical protein RL090_511 [Bacteroidota bacterium]|jgi:uncharacterized protein YicC (UPF0701 family)
METIKIKQKLTSFIQKAQEEIDTLRVKAALGRMDAADVLYEMTKDMNHNLQALNKELRNEGSDLSKKVEDYMERIRYQVALGKAEAGKVYEERKEEMRRTMVEFDHWLKNEGLGLSPETRLRIQNELEKFRLKLDILRIRYELGRLEARDVMQEKHDRFKQEFDQIVSSVKTDLGQKKEEIGVKLSSAYDALRRTWQS